MSKISDLKFDDKNFNKHTQAGMGLLEKSLKEFGAGRSILIDKDNNIIAGNGIIEAAGQAGFEKVKIVETTGDEIVAVKRTDVSLNSDMGREMALADNATAAADLEWDKDTIGEFFEPEDVEKWNIDLDWGDTMNDYESGALTDRFGAPPYSVLDAKQGYWQARKEQWLSLGIKSEVGRDNNLIGEGLQKLLEKSHRNTAEKLNGTSVFDPVLTELMYRWFAKESGSVLDPFAGGSVRGIVASKLGLTYTGCELRPEQVEANRDNANAICKSNVPMWVEGDSNKTIDSLDETYDFVFSCPPYADLEVYSDDPADLSTMEYKDFLATYRSIIKKAVSKLKDNRFAAFVISEVRDRKGVFVNLVPDTIKAFEDAGMQYYNEIILLNNIVTAGLRANKTFGNNRKVIRVHQNVVVFYKGDVSKIKDNFSILKGVDFNE